MFRTTPLSHQATIFEKAKGQPFWGLFAEMGTGKTKMAIDLVNYNHAHYDSHVVLVFCLRSVLQTWVREIETHSYHPYALQVWNPNRKPLPRHSNKDRLQFYLFNYEALITEKAKEQIRHIINRRSFQIIVDEGYYFKNPSSKRTKSLFRLRKRSSFRYILNGTPVSQNIFDIYAQVKFLDMSFTDSYGKFKATYGVWRKVKADNRFGYFKKLVSYRNVESALDLIRSRGSIVRKSECLDLPDKVREERFVPLSKEQKDLLRELDETGKVGDHVPENLLVKNTIIHRILGGSISDDELLDNVPKLEELQDLMEYANGQVIIWARLHCEIDRIKRLLDCPSYDGRNSKADNDSLETRFQNGDVPVMVATQRKAGVGLTLTQGTFVIYYSNDHSFYYRIQSEDRSHRHGLKTAVTYTDLFANHPLEKRMHKRMMERFSMHDYVMKDNDLIL